MFMKRYPFIAADFTVPINTTSVTPTNFTALEVPLKGVWMAGLTMYVKGGHASCSATVTFVFVSYDSLRDAWDTVAYYTGTVAMVGTAAAQVTVVFDASVEKIKLYSIHNPETSTGYTAICNASLIGHFME